MFESLFGGQRSRCRVAWLVGFVAMASSLGVTTGQLAAQEPQPPRIAEASEDGERAIQQFEFPSHLRCRLFAAEPMLANPVAFHIDFNGRLFVCESFRQEQGVEDNRNHAEWLNDDLAAQTVEDRVAYIRRHWGDSLDHYTNQDDRIRQLDDLDDDGVADRSTVFADHFNQIPMGTGAGVLSYRDRVWYTCIPDLWSLVDLDSDGVSDERESVHSGFGVRFAFRGHDMHGLIVGPDGRLYFSIGDRGYNVGERIADPASGAVFRCELDGSQLEVVATGLRNPQELAFDDFGNLFTGDNNSDSGDRARWVYVVPGGDSGWRMYYQYLPDRGPFNRERIWHPYDADTPAYIVPPVTNLADGPSGLAWYPGTGFGEAFRDRFFLCDFRGDASNSGIRSFRVQPIGAFWEVVDMEQTIWKTLATDVQFGPDGRLYVSDWVFGWVGENKGRIYTWEDPAAQQSDVVAETRAWLEGGIAAAEADQLVELLGHPDQRVRQEAQFAMVERRLHDELVSAALDTKRPLRPRVHAIWGIGQLYRLGISRPQNEVFEPLLLDLEAEIRSQSLSVLSDMQPGMVDCDKLAEHLDDESSRVRYFASLALARHGMHHNLPAIIPVLIANNDVDPIVRHGAITMMAGIARSFPDGVEWLKGLATHPNYSVRIAAVVALRKLAAPEINVFLQDPDPRVVVEAARAIYDVPIDAAMPELARLIETASFPDALVRRVVNANLRMGTAESALALAAFAASENAAADRRIEALEILGKWESPQSIDRVTGDWRPLPKRPRVDATRALNRNMAAILNGTDEVPTAFVRVAGQVRLEKAADEIERLVMMPTNTDRRRCDAFTALLAIDEIRGLRAARNLAGDWNALPPELASRIVRTMADADADSAVDLMREALDANEDATAEQLRAQRLFLDVVAEMESKTASAVLAELVNRAIRDRFPAQNRLDLILASEKHEDATSVAEALASYRRQIGESGDPLAAYRDVLIGGDVASGRRLFFERTDLSCLRCHTVDGQGGEVGPDLSGVALNRDRRYLLESIVLPNQTIADGYTQTVLLTDDGVMHTGLVVERDDDRVVLLDADGERVEIESGSIEVEKPGQSSMPTDLIDKLDRRDLRDLIEYLSNRRTPPPDEPSAARR